MIYFYSALKWYDLSILLLEAILSSRRPVYPVRLSIFSMFWHEKNETAHKLRLNFLHI